MLFVNKLVRKFEPVRIYPTEVTLLTAKEYSAYKHNIPPVRNWFWLKSPSINSILVDVAENGSIGVYFVDCPDGIIRPVIKLQNNVSVGEEYDIKGTMFVAISENMLLCKNEIGYGCFRKNIEAEDANVYEKSDVKNYINDWAKEKGIM